MTLRTMQINVTGLSAEARALGVVSDNIANVNTPGYKRQREWFEDALNRNGSGKGFGAGVRLDNIQSVFSQGHLAQTGIATDLAIQGNGFFAVNGNVAGVTGTYFTRAGQFHMGPNGTILNPESLALLGRPTGPDGRLTAEVVPLTVPVSGLAAHPTQLVDMAANLDAGDVAPTAAWDPNNAASTSNASAGTTIFDSLGSGHPLGVYFRKLSDGNWEYHAVVAGEELNPAQPGVQVEVGSGTASFTSDGALDTFTATQPISVSFAGGASASQNVDLSLGTPMASGGSGLDGTTQFSAPSSVSRLSQDGYSSGSASGVSVRQDGMVEVQYTNGESRPIGQVVLAQFRSPNGLLRAGQGLFMQSKESGQAVLGGPGTGGRGDVTAGSIESSNVDLAEEMVGMIRHQRAFGANSKVISTADDMLAAFMNIKS